MTSVRFQGKPLIITVIQAYAPTSNAEETEVERFYEDLQDILELTPKKASWVVPHSVGPRFPGPLLIRTRYPDTSPNSSL